jgi:DUF4097 and DUF4098 domain-containing protein YvlB
MLERNAVQVKPKKGVVIKGLKVDNRLGDVEVIGSDEPGIAVYAVKRAKDGEVLERLKVNMLVPERSGTVEIGTMLLAGEEAKPVEAGTIRIDLTITVPRKAGVEVKAWNGKIAVTGLRNGAALQAHESSITVTDVVGAVQTLATRGKQRLTSVRGTVTAGATYGEMSLDAISGDALLASVHDGTVTATRIRSRQVTLRTTIGDISFSGELLAGGNVDVRSYKGDVEIRVAEKKGLALEVDAWSRKGQVDTQLELAGLATEKGRVRGTFGTAKKPASLEVGSTLGRVTIGLLNE